MASNKQQKQTREARERLKRYTARQQVHENQHKRRVRDNVLAVVGFVVVVGLAGALQFFYFNGGPGTASPTPTPTVTAEANGNIGAPDPSLSQYRDWTGTLTLNNDIALGITLDGADAPQAVAGWVQDFNGNYYPGKTCHRMSNDPGFSFIQCGSIDGTGSEDPGFSYGPIENAPSDGDYPAGTIAMARASDNANSQGHQFFIVTADTQLPSDSAGGYTVVGHVTSGLDKLISEVMDKGVDPETVDPTVGGGAPNVRTQITALTLN